MRFVTVLLITLFFGAASAHSETAPPPFVLPDGEDSQLIPEGFGMRFFEDKWHYIGRTGMYPTTVTGKAFINDDTGVSTPYRVLVAAPRYVLLAELLTPSDVGMSGRPWTTFVALTLRGYEGANPFDPSSNMIHHTCSHESMAGGAQAFSWPLGKLMQVFENSHCFRGIIPTAAEPFGDGWSRTRYQRRLSPEGYQKRPLKWRQ
jgi:hypothetical protein